MGTKRGSSRPFAAFRSCSPDQVSAADGKELVPDSELALYHVVIFQRGPGHGLGLVDGRLVQTVRQLLDEKIRSRPEATAIDLWLESPGGDAHAAYKLALLLRSRTARLRVVVPDYAKSAATLIACAADEILMASTAELGPLDVQIEHPDREGVVVSGLDVAGALEQLGEQAVELALTGGGALVQATGLSRPVVLHEALPFAAQLLEPVIAKLDPHLIHRAANELKVAEKYAGRLLRMSLPGKKGKVVADPDDIASTLVGAYPAHGFVISRAEATDLGLPVGIAEDHPRWIPLYSLFREYERGNDVLVCVLEDRELDQKAQTEKDGSHAMVGDRSSKPTGSEGDAVEVGEAGRRTAPQGT